MTKQKRLTKAIEEILKSNIIVKYPRNHIVISDIGNSDGKVFLKKNSIVYSGVTGHCLGIIGKTIFMPFTSSGIFKNVLYSKITEDKDGYYEENGLVVSKANGAKIRLLAEWIKEQSSKVYTLIIFLKENQVQFIRVEGDYREFHHLDTSITHFKENEAAFIDKLKTWDRWDDDVNIVNAKNYHYAIVIY